MILLGLTGPMASGKSTVVQVLIEKGYKVATLSDAVREECRRQGLMEVRENLMKCGEGLRAEYGVGVLAARALERVRKEGGEKWVIDGIRNPAEADVLGREPNFFLIANTAPEDLIVERVLSRGRADDGMSPTREDILKKLRRELGQGEPPEGQQVEKCIKMADAVFKNDMPMSEVPAAFEAFLKSHGFA